MTKKPCYCENCGNPLRESIEFVKYDKWTGEKIFRTRLKCGKRGHNEYYSYTDRIIGSDKVVERWLEVKYA